MDNYVQEFLDGRIIVCPEGNAEQMKSFLSMTGHDTVAEMKAIDRGILTYKDKASFRFNSNNLNYAPIGFYEDMGKKISKLMAYYKLLEPVIEEEEIMNLFE